MKHLQLTDELLEAASMYATGAMPESERKMYVHHLETEGCELCRAEVLELQSAMHALAIDLPESTPSPAAKMRLMAQAELSASMRGIQNRAQPRRFEWLAWLISAAATAALVGVLFLNSNLRNQVNSLHTRISELGSTKVRIVNLSGQGVTPQAGARVFWDQVNRRWLFYVSNLQPVSKDKTYQLWFVPKNGAPVSASVFNTDADGSVTIEVSVPPGIGELKAAAVTTEPAGGLPQPSGSFVLFGEL
jgi:anti-sigma-K factor RskA